MIRVFLIFLILAVLTHFGIQGFRSLTGKEKWGLTKSLGYAILCSLLAIAVMISIVIVF